jgi:hypothetical protein
MMIYVNSYAVTYREGEFFIELKLNSPDKEEVAEAVYMSPVQAKGFMMTLQQTIIEYESKYGELSNPVIVREKEARGEFQPSFYV